jgi:hypothetical protein
MDEDQAQRRAWIYERLVWSLRWLAAEPEAALVALDRGFPPDVEMAETLADVLPALGPDIVDQHALDAIRAIDDAFGLMARQEELWTAEAVRTHDLWRHQRERARAVLVMLNEERADDQLHGNA